MSISGNCTDFPAEFKVFGLIVVTILYILVFTLNIFNIIFLQLIQKNKYRFHTYISLYSVVMMIEYISLFFHVISFNGGEWPFNSVACKINGGLLEFSMIMSTFILLWISLDQYLYVFYSINYFKILNSVKQNMISTTVFCAIISSVYPWFYECKKNDCQKNICAPNYSSIFLTKIALAFRTIVLYILPSIFMLIFYTKIIFYLRCKKMDSTNYQGILRKKNTNENKLKNKGKEDYEIGEINDEQIFDDIKNKVNVINKKRVIFPMAAIFGIFFLTWTPNMIVRWLSVYFEINRYVNRFTQFLWLLNPVLHPIVYTITNKAILLKLRARFRNWRIFTK